MGSRSSTSTLVDLATWNDDLAEAIVTALSSEDGRGLLKRFIDDAATPRASLSVREHYTRLAQATTEFHPDLERVFRTIGERVSTSVVGAEAAPQGAARIDDLKSQAKTLLQAVGANKIPPQAFDLLDDVNFSPELLGKHGSDGGVAALAAFVISVGLNCDRYKHGIIRVDDAREMVKSCGSKI